MTLLHTLAAFVLALGVLVAFHEYGHYLAARIAGVKVLRFCLGFGRPLWSRRFGRDGTEWAVAAFPLGGYVKLLGHDPDEPVPPADAHRSFNAQPVARRMFVIVAGPLANFLLAIALYWGLNLNGVNEPPAMVAAPLPGSPAARAGLAAGDLIVGADGVPVASWNGLAWRLLRAAEARAVVKLEVRDARGGIGFPVLDLSRLETLELEGDLPKLLGITPFRPRPRVVQVEAGSPAERAGLRAGDVLLSVDGVALAGGDQFVAAMRSGAGRERAIEVLAGGAQREVRVTPASAETAEGRIGRIGARISDRLDPVRVRYAPGEGLWRACTQTYEMSVFSLKMLGKMVIGEVSWRNLSGPVTIADYAGKTARLGLVYYLNFIALVSISLGILNLLPVPMLDGGHLLYYLAEILRGKPVSEKVMELGTRFGLALVVTTMALALYNDIHRLLAG